MRSAAQKGGWTVVLAFALAFGIGLARHALAGNVDLGLQDEGFLWAGSLRAADGALPLLDFRSYDPGRYWWCAAWMPLVGHGLVGLRLACTLFGSLGLFAGLLAASRCVERRWLLVPIALLLAVWMQPRWKPFEPAVALIGVWLGTRLVERPDGLRHLALGLWVGLAAIVGKNLGLYAGASSFLLVAVVARQTRADELLGRLGALLGGALAGYAPVLVLGLFRPDFANAVLDSVGAIVEQGRTNLTREVPWPWSFAYAGHPLGVQLVRLATGCAFVLLPLVLLLALGVIVFVRGTLEQRALLLPAALIGLAWSHHALERSDLFHLAQAIHPTLLAALALPAALGGVSGGARNDAWVALVLVPLGAIAAGAAAPQDPLARTFGAGGARFELVPFELHATADETLRIGRPMAERLEAIRAVVARHVPADAPLFVGPQRPTLYPLLGKRPPTWDTYLLWPSERAEARLLDELASVDWALLHEVQRNEDAPPLDRVHPRVAWLFASEFERVDDPELPGSWSLVHRKGAR